MKLKYFLVIIFILICTYIFLDYLDYRDNKSIQEYVESHNIYLHFEYIKANKINTLSINGKPIINFESFIDNGTIDFSVFIRLKDGKILTFNNTIKDAILDNKDRM